jgi:NADH-quinone oxidoreductase subunit M
MTDGSLIALLVAVPFAGAAAGFALWSRPQALKAWALLVAFANFAGLVAIAEGASGSGTVPLFLPLFPLVAFLSLLGQPAHPDNRSAWLLTLVLLGLGHGALFGGEGVGLALLALLLGLVGAMLYRYRSVSGTAPWWGIGTYGLGTICAIVALIAVPPVSSVAFLVSCAILLPLVPFHGGYVAAFRGLPGNLPAFLALLLPGLGFYELRTLIPGLSGPAVWTVTILAIAGMLYGMLKALVQSRVRLILAYAGLSFLSILWWYIAVTRTAPPQAVVYLTSVGLVTSGFLLAWYAIQARYGDVDLRAIRGVAYLMPRFSILVFLMALAAIGLPPFGVYSGFMGLLLTPALPLSGALVVIIGTMLAACWYFLGLTQQLLFGPHRPDLRYEDLCFTEAAALVMIVVLLMALGIVPPRFLESSKPMSQAQSKEFLAWNR